MGHPDIQELLKALPREVVVRAIRDTLSRLRQELRAGGREQAPEAHEVHEMVVQRAREISRPRLRKVINATGVILHTNLGRAVLSQAAREALDAVAGHYCNLELDLETGERGSRQDHVRDLLRELTGAEDALVVNNNAGAVLLALNTLARGKPVVVSRGQLVEIGGSFRLPEIMAASGAILVEVGTTNKTYLRDYEQAVGPETALLLRVHTSNFRIIGFAAEVGIAELAGLGRRLGIPVMEDLGSGLLVDLGGDFLRDEPVVVASLAAGADVVTFSGDKLLGGPQAGIILGREKYLEPMRKNPLARALRIDKLSLAALEATLRLYLDPDWAKSQIPTLHALFVSVEELRRRAERLRDLLVPALRDQAEAEVQTGFSEAGGGSLPGVALPTFLVLVRPRELSVEELAARLRRAEPPVIARRLEGALALDVRTMLEGEEALVVRAVATCLEA
jgi:L-seryl-tRNA(Ser) seleniumtransferase